MGKIETYHNYVSTVKLGLNTENILQVCNYVEDDVLKRYGHLEGNYDGGKGIETTKLFNHYNFLMYPLPEMGRLYKNICHYFREISKSEEECFIQCWLNIFNKGDYIDWHGHWRPEFDSWHGFYCVNAEPSVTSYKVPGIDSQIDVINKNDQLVISPSGGDLHRTWDWDYENPRVTIAFDIVPGKNIIPEDYENHWIPVI